MVQAGLSIVGRGDSKFFRSCSVLDAIKLLSILNGAPCHRTTGEPARGPCCLEIEAARDAVNVQQFASEKKSWTNSALHGLEADFAEANAAAGDEFVLVQAFARHLKLRAQQLLRQLVLC